MYIMRNHCHDIWCVWRYNMLNSEIILTGRSKIFPTCVMISELYFCLSTIETHNIQQLLQYIWGTKRGVIEIMVHIIIIVQQVKLTSVKLWLCCILFVTRIYHQKYIMMFQILPILYTGNDYQDSTIISMCLGNIHYQLYYTTVHSIICCMNTLCCLYSHLEHWNPSL